MKEYCLIQSGSPTDLSKAVQDNLDQGWVPHGSLVSWLENSFECGVRFQTQWLVQPIVRDKPTTSEQLVKDLHDFRRSETVLNTLILSRQQVPGSLIHITADFLEELITVLTQEMERE